MKGFGRVIIVYATDAEAALAKKEGDRLFLDVDLGEDVGRKRGHQRSASQPAHGYVSSPLYLATWILVRSFTGGTRPSGCTGTSGKDHWKWHMQQLLGYTA